MCLPVYPPVQILIKNVHRIDRADTQVRPYGRRYKMDMIGPFGCA